MSLSSEEVELLLQVARDAALGASYAERIDAITETLQALVPTTALSVIVVSPEGGSHAYVRNNSLENLLEYVERYRAHDPMGHVIEVGDGTPRVLGEFCSPRKFGKDPFTGEFLTRHRIRHVMGLALPMPDDRRLALAFQREAGLGEFTRHERELLRLVGPDLSRAAFGCLLREKLSALTLEEVQDESSGALVLDAQGDVLHASPSALALCRRLVSQAQFPAEAIVADARQLAQGSPREGVTVVRHLPLDDGSWVRSETSALESRPGTDVLCVLQHIRADGGEGVFEAVAQEANLTLRERQVAALAIEGLGNRGIAHKLGLSQPTVGTYLVRAYKKVGVSGRTELARRMTGGKLDGL